MNILHTPVFLQEAIEQLNIKKNGIYIDATFGCGGHSKCILSTLGKNGFLYAMDRDPYAISLAQKIKDNRFQSIYSPFSKLEFYIKKYNLIRKIDGILLDLGISSLQINNPKRGFSFMQDGPLDMRMDLNTVLSASQWLLHAREKEISFILKNFGEEPFSKRIAHAIIKERNKRKTLKKTKELVNIICSTIPKIKKHKHPARRCFQAIRIHINDELQEIQKILESSADILAPSGRLVVISFHSLEDRIVKRFIRKHSYPKNFSKVFCIKKNFLLFKNFKFNNLGKIFPSAYEIANNPRSRSAVLRVAERTII